MANKKSKAGEPSDLSKINRNLPSSYRLKKREDGQIVLTFRDDVMHVHDFRESGSPTDFFERKQRMLRGAIDRSGVSLDIDKIL